MKGSPLSGENTLDRIISYCQSHSIQTIPTREASVRPAYNSNVVKVGNFIFDAHGHSTGCVVRCWIVTDDGDSLEILDVPYWYSSDYTFNDSKWDRGAWDKELSAAIMMLDGLVKDHKEQMAKQKELYAKEKESKELDRKSKFEVLFKT
jgi:hypothetical protein